MTHQIATRNPNAKVTRPSAKRLARLIGLMSRYWVDADFAADDMKDLRLAVSKAFLVNHLGLHMFIEERVKEGLRPIQIHHLPRQDPSTIEHAISLLTDHELKTGVGDELRALAHRHPFSGGDVPEKPGWTRAEATALGIQYQSRGGDGKTLKQACLELISEIWLSNREWGLRMRTTRLAAVIDELRADGYDISVELRVNESGSGMPYAVYHYFTDPDKRAAWKEEQAIKELQRTQEEAKAAALKEAEEKARRDQKVLDAAARRAGRKTLAKTPHSGGSQYGGWVKPGSPQGGVTVKPSANRQLFKAPVQQAAPTRPPAEAMARLGSLQGKGPPKIEVDSAPHIPAAALNKAFPNARSRDVVQLGGLSYTRRFRARKDGETVVAWEVSWELVQRQAS